MAAVAVIVTDTVIEHGRNTEVHLLAIYGGQPGNYEKIVLPHSLAFDPNWVEVILTVDDETNGLWAVGVAPITKKAPDGSLSFKCRTTPGNRGVYLWVGVSQYAGGYYGYCKVHLGRTHSIPR